ncbi:hypothetical protein RsTz2092_04530 [Deferribacterales bacterium RsTz2092]|nr:hypothetical protein AGMMS49941_08800 [Deferribacterales bacterium]
MIYADVNPLAEVRHNREKLLEIYGGIDGLHRHMNEERPELERQGWKFVDPKEVATRNNSAQNV